VFYHYDLDGHLLAETDATGATLREYVWQDRQPVAMVAQGGGGETIAYLHTDHLNTPRRATDSAGVVVWEWKGDAFGAVPPVEDRDGDGVATTVKLRFPGQYYDGETGLVYNYFRDYDPSIGRYAESDPIGLAGGLNTYTYAIQNPLKFHDPTGLIVPAFVAACAANPACAATVATAARSLAGAIIGGLSALNEVSRDPCYHGEIGDAVIIGSAFGAITGALPGAGSLAAATTRGAIAGSVGNAAGQIERNDNFSLSSNVAAAVIGGVSSGLGNISGLSGSLHAVRSGLPSHSALAVGASEGSAITTLTQFSGGMFNNAIFSNESCTCGGSIR
jgi:RHS repeat-associated protein